MGRVRDSPTGAAGERSPVPPEAEVADGAPDPERARRLGHRVGPQHLAPPSDDDPTVRRKIGAEIEVGGSKVELMEDEEPREMTQGQTLAIEPVAGGTADLQAEGPSEKVALAEFVTGAYSEDEMMSFLGAIGTLGRQAAEMKTGLLPEPWTAKGGDAVRVAEWPAKPTGSFQFTVSPVEGTVPQFFNAFQPTQVPEYTKEEGLQRKQPESPKLAALLSRTRVEVAKDTAAGFWALLGKSGLSSKVTTRRPPPAVMNLSITLSEAVTWRFGLLLKEIGSTLKNALDVLPKFDLGAYVDAVLSGYVDPSDLSGAKKLLVQAMVDALKERSQAVAEAAGKEVGQLMEFAESEIKTLKSNLGDFEEAEKQPEHQGLQLAVGLARRMFGDEAQHRARLKLRQREVADLQGLAKGGLATTVEDAVAIISGKRPLLGDIQANDPDSVLQDEGSLIPVDEDAPEGAFEVRNPFDGKVPAEDWKDAADWFLDDLGNRGVKY